jgi:hypothetical protein
METRTGENVRLPGETRTFSKIEAQVKLREGWKPIKVIAETDEVVMIFEDGVARL